MTSRSRSDRKPWQPAEGRAAPASGRGRRTRDRIIAAALEVFGERGFHETNMLEIAQRAEVASGTVYQYFSDKSDLFAYLLTELRDRLHRETRMSADEQGRLQARDGVERYLEVYREYAAIYRVWWELLQPPTPFTDEWLDLHGKSRRELARAIGRGQEGGLVAADLDSGLVADLTLAMFDRPAYTRIVLGWDDELTDAAMANLMDRLLGGGLSADQPR